MSPVLLDLAARTALTDAVRTAAATEILPRFRNLSPSDISSKTSRDDLVTEADKRAEERIERAARGILPGAFVLGEEAVASEPALLDRLGDAELAVVIDPVDGTWNYAHGLATFGTILAVMSRGVPVWALLYDPSHDDWIEAAPGEGAWMKDSRGRTRRLDQPMAKPMARLDGFMPVRQFPMAQQAALAEAAYDFGQVLALRCSCHEYRAMATGQMDFAITSGSKPWDHVAGQLVLAELGGGGRSPDGTPYHAGRNAPLISASRLDTLERVRARLNFLSQ